MTTMDFFGHQEQARRTTRLLVFFFVLAVAGIVAAVYLAAAVLLQASGPQGPLWNPALFAGVTAAVLLVVALAAGFRTSQLRAGGASVALLLGGRPVDPGTKDPRERRLQNVVEELAIAAGVPVPSVFVLADEPGINAFAAGWGTADAAITVTAGCLDNLSRDELQGVVAHEFSHVFHGDMRLNIRLMGILFGIVCIATIGEIIVRSVGRPAMRGSGRNKGGAGAIVLFGVALLAIGWIGSFFAGLIRAAVSRQREFLADASAVAYTRNPLGIGLALARIAGLGSRLATPHAREAGHMLFADGVRRWFGNLGATHPPLEERIERVLPGFRAELARGGDLLLAAQRTPPPPVAAPAAAAFAGGPGERRVRSAELPGLVGGLEPRFLQKARQLLDGLSLDLHAAAREPERARALLYALLLAEDGQGAQAAVLDRCGAVLAHEARALAPAVRRLHEAERLPLVELLLPALRRLPDASITALHTEAGALARADATLTPFEFAVLKIVQRNVPLPDRAPPRRARRPLPLQAARRQVELVLSVLAHESRELAAQAFAAGAAVLAGLPLALRPAAECRLADLDPALDALAELSPAQKRLLLTACAHAAGADGSVAAAEGELLRAFAAHWDCPLPPVWAPGEVAVG